MLLKKKKIATAFCHASIPHLKVMSAERDCHIVRTLICGTTEY